MNPIIVIVAALLLTGAYAQSVQVGAYLSRGKELHSTHFTALPGTFSCSPGFRSTLGDSWGLGAITTLTQWSIPLPLLRGVMSPTLRVGYESWSVTFTAREQQPIGLDTTLTTATIEHRARVQGSFLSLHGGATIRVSSSPIVIEPRLWAAFARSPQYEQGEYLVEPERRGRFLETGTRSRNLSSGHVDSAQRLQLGFALGVGWEIPLTQQLRLRPEIHVQVPFRSLFGDIRWHVYSLRTNIAVLLSPSSPPQPNPAELQHEPTTTRGDTSVFIVTDEQPAQLPPLDLWFVTRDSNGIITPVHKVIVTSQTRQHIRPLLPYIFFEENSSQIPNRYVLLDSHSVRGFTETELHPLSTLESYYHLLNIVGLRMKQHSTATLVITGCTMGTGPESNRLDLAEDRARAIRTYLHSVWGIDTSRCRITAQLLPTRPSPIGHPDGNAENARVELYSTHPAILAPILGFEEDHTVTPPSVLLHIDSPRRQVSQWELTLMDRLSAIATYNGQDRLPTYIPLSVQWARLAGDTLQAVLKRRMLSLNHSTEDRHVQSLPVIHQQDTTSPPHETYSLILFDFDDATIPPSQYRMIEMIRHRITPATHIRIIGYTDRLGNLPYNVRLAERRAQAIARALGAEQHATIIAEGSRTLLYDNSLPEGRFYSRTIIIELEHRQ